jgi:hypothetical protein
MKRYFFNASVCLCEALEGFYSFIGHRTVASEHELSQKGPKVQIGDFHIKGSKVFIKCQ